MMPRIQKKIVRQLCQINFFTSYYSVQTKSTYLSERQFDLPILFFSGHVNRIMKYLNFDLYVKQSVDMIVYEERK